MQQRRRNLRFLILISLSLFAASCVSAGTILQGRKFGVEVGMPFDEAKVTLSNSGLQTSTWVNNHLVVCGGRSRAVGEELALFVDDSRPNDEICLWAQAGRVVAISWSHNPLAVIAS